MSRVGMELIQSHSKKMIDVMVDDKFTMEELSIGKSLVST